MGNTSEKFEILSINAINYFINNLEDESGIHIQPNSNTMIKISIENSISSIKCDDIENEFIDQLKHELNSIFATNDYTNLLDNCIDILNEQAIIASENEILRPDKIIIKEKQTLVVDFKTGLPNKKYANVISQVNFDRKSLKS